MATALDEQGCDHAADADMLTEFLVDRDERAFERLVARHGPTVLRACPGILGDLVEADPAHRTRDRARAARFAALDTPRLIFDQVDHLAAAPPGPAGG